MKPKASQKIRFHEVTNACRLVNTCIYIYIIFMDYQHTNNYGDYQLVTTNWFVLCFIFWHLSFNQETVEVVQARVATDMSVPILCQKILGEKFHGEISIAPPKTEMDTPPENSLGSQNEGSEEETPWKKGWFSSCTLVLEKCPKSMAWKRMAPFENMACLVSRDVDLRMF